MNESPSPSTTKPISEPEAASEPRLESLYHVIILNDDEHSYEYVIEMLQSAVGLSQAEAVARTVEADTTGSSIVVTCSLEDAEHKRDRIHSFGPDPRMPQSRGSVAALIEPAAR